MSAYPYVEPEVAGGLGPDTVLDRSTHPPTAHRLHYVFEGWLGDSVLESFPFFIATNKAVQTLAALGATGVDTAEVRVSQADNGAPVLVLPKYLWLQVVGRAGEDDFGIAPDHRLVLSDRVLRAVPLPHAVVEPFP